MLSWLKARSNVQAKAEKLYGGVVAAARQPMFYGEGRVADAPQGRFEMVLLHLFLLVERLAKDGKEGAQLSQALIETFVADMDDCMREMGVGDMAVPKRVKRAAALFYKRAIGYRAGMLEALREPANDAPLAAFLQSALLPDGGDQQFGRSLAAYAAHLAQKLAGCSSEDIMRDDFSLTSLAATA